MVDSPKNIWATFEPHETGKGHPITYATATPTKGVKYIRADLATLSEAVAEREAEPVASVAEVRADGQRLYNTVYPSDALDKFPIGTLLYTTPPTSELEAMRKRVADLEKALEWQPIETAPLNVTVDLWCVEADSPASWGNGRPAGEIVRNRHKSEIYGWFGNQSNDGVPRGHAQDLIPVGWRQPTPDIPLAMVEAFIETHAASRVREGGKVE